MTTQPDIWTRLAEPFPPDEVKQRPGAATWQHKPECEGARCRLTRDADKHMQLHYVDARAVAQRLDDVLTPRGWRFTCAVIPGSDIVKGRLEVRELYENAEDLEWIVREDHGYPNSDRDEEPVKAATSDALKRCAVLFGIGRHLYDDNQHRSHGGPGSSSPAPHPGGAAGRPLRPVASTVPPEPEDIAQMFHAPAGRPTAPDEDGTCPQHGKPWRENSRGFFCATKVGDGWCDEQPTQRWKAARSAGAVR